MLKKKTITYNIKTSVDCILQHYINVKEYELDLALEVVKKIKGCIYHKELN